MVSNDRTIHSTAFDTNFDTRFEFNNFYQDQKEVGMRTFISHKKDMIRNFQLKMEEKHMESLYCLMSINTERKYVMMSLMVEINLAVRKQICLKIGIEKAKQKFVGLNKSP